MWLSVVAPVQAAGETLDQQQTTGDRATSGRTPMAQTFQAGMSGAIDRVSLMLAPGQSGATASVEIQEVSGGQPDGVVLGSSPSAAIVACCNQWQDFSFSPTVPVAAGTEYAIVLLPLGYVVWYASFSADTYANGQLWIQSGVWQYNSNLGKDFAFKTWVVPAVAADQPPSLAAASSAVSAPEGSSATNSGTYSDPDGDTVALSASTGTLAKTGGTSGTWSWSLAGADEAAAQNVTITADDGHGQSAVASFSVTFTAVAPTVTITGAPASGPEGTGITLTGKASSASAEDIGAGFTLTWTVTKDGNPFTTGTGPTLTLTPDDEGTFVATLQAVDDGGGTASTSVTINGLNVAPSAHITGVTHGTLVLVAHAPVTFSAGFTDPGALDVHSATLDFGDGSPAVSQLFAAGASGATTQTHVFASAGTYTVAYTVGDDDGGVSTASTKVTVASPAQALATIYAYLQTVSLDKGEKKDLSDKLQQAIKAAGRGNVRDTCKAVDDFLGRLVELSRGPHKLSASNLSALSSSAWAVHRELGCTHIRAGWFRLDL